MRKAFILCLFAWVALLLGAEDHNPQEHASAGDLSATTESMSHEHHHQMGPHMHMSSLRTPQPGDAEKAQKVAEQARQSLEKYKDYRAALADGYKIFLPNVPQKMYHFTNWEYAMGEAFRFDPTKPTSLLYNKTPDGYQLIGVMYTAPVRFTEDQLNERIPLSVAQWHQHVNLCKPPKGREAEQLGKNSKFGLNGSISSREECEAAGGTFTPHLFGWMVHLYPWEKSPDAIWSVERQLQSKPGEPEHHHHDSMNQ